MKGNKIYLSKRKSAIAFFFLKIILFPVFIIIFVLNTRVTVEWTFWKSKREKKLGKSPKYK